MPRGRHSGQRTRRCEGEKEGEKEEGRQGKPVFLVSQVVTERDALLHSLKELQQQRQDVMGQSREMNIKYDSMQEAVNGSSLSPHHSSLPPFLFLLLLLFSPPPQLSEAQAESERLKLQLLTANSRWEQEQSALQEQM